LNLYPADHDQAFAEVDLHLLARRRLEPHGRPRLGFQLLPVWLDRTLDGAQRHRDRLLGSQFLTHHIRIATMQPEPLFQPSLMAVEPLLSCRLLERPPAASLDVALHRAPAHAELRRDPPRAPAKLLQPQHRRDLIRLYHHIPPRARCPQSA